MFWTCSSFQLPPCCMYYSNNQPMLTPPILLALQWPWIHCSQLVQCGLRGVCKHKHWQVWWWRGAFYWKFFSVIIQLCFALILILIQWLLQIFAHAMTAQLSWHVQKFASIWWPGIELQWYNFHHEFKSNSKRSQVKCLLFLRKMGPRQHLVPSL